MTRTVANELEAFESHIEALKKSHSVECPCPYGYIISPAEPQATGGCGKPVALTLTGIVHGNELAGLAIINGVLALLRSGLLKLPYRLGVALGNPEASLKDVRFLEKDLNRSFGNDLTEMLEQRRAKELESLLSQTFYYVDFHQTAKHAPHPFFIFPFERAGFDFAREIAPHQAIVTHWGDSFSSEGMCTDEFVNKNGGVGITCEMGQNGFDPYQISSGIDVALWSMQVVGHRLGVPGFKSVERRHQLSEPGPIYTWAQVAPWPEDADEQVLDEGWHNFKHVEKGERVGQVKGKPLLAEASGAMIFPKYLSGSVKLVQKPTELYRVMKVVGEDELPG